MCVSLCVCLCVHLLSAGVLSGCAAADPETFEFSERPCQQTEMAKGFSFIYSLCVCTCLSMIDLYPVEGGCRYWGSVLLLERWGGGGGMGGCRGTVTVLAWSSMSCIFHSRFWYAAETNLQSCLFGIVSCNKLWKSFRNLTFLFVVVVFGTMLSCVF